MKLLGIKQIRERFPVSKTHIYRLIGQKRFPPPTRIGGRSFWREEAVDEAIERLLGDERDEAPEQSETDHVLA